MFNSCPRKIFCANTPLPTAEALVWWAGACQPGSSSDVSNPQCGTLINAARRRCVWVTPCVLLCYTLVLRRSAAPQVTLLKHACRASILSLRRAIRALLQTSAAERGGKDPVGLPLMNWNHPSSFGTPLWVKLIQIKMASEACLTPAGITWAILGCGAFIPHAGAFVKCCRRPQDDGLTARHSSHANCCLTGCAPSLAFSFSWWGTYRQRDCCPLYRQENQGQKWVTWLPPCMQTGNGGVTIKRRSSDSLFSYSVFGNFFLWSQGGATTSLIFTTNTIENH